MALTDRIVSAAEEKGVLLRQGAPGCNYNQGGDHIQISPAYVITRAEVDDVVAVLDEVLSEVALALPS